MWKGAAIAACFAAICAAAITWQAHNAKVTELKFAEDARSCRARADQGDAKAESELAYMYSHGQGVPQDYDQALYWRRKAADQGYAGGEDGLGYMYSYGQGVPQDYAAAFRWYRKAADQGDARGQNDIALMYELGQGVPQDYAEALGWYRKAADQGYASAQYNLGNMYYYGRGVPRDPAEAVRWYQKAADQGNEYAERVLHMKWKGMGAVMKISLSIGFLGGLLLLAGSLTPSGSFGGGNRRRSALAGLLVLSLVALDLFGFRYVGILTPISAIAAFQFVKGLLTGTSVAFLLPIVLPNNIWPKVVKTGLVIYTMLFIGTDLLLVANYKPRSAVLALRSFWLLSALSLGMIVSLAIVLWLAAKGRREQDNSGLVAASDSDKNLSGDEP
jgi:hypothetical protein